VSVLFAKAIQQGLDFYGVRWRLLNGCETRGNGQASDYQGLLTHHTASESGPAPSVLWLGRPDLDPPLCNSAGEADGTICFVAYNPANHAGASGGRSMGPLPVTRTFNKYVWGHEIVYPGTSPMNVVQYYSATVLGAVISNILQRPTAEWVRAHAETSVTGKWDPGSANNHTIDMAAFRNDVMGIRRRSPGEDNDLKDDERLWLQTVYNQITGNNFQGWDENFVPKGPGLSLVDIGRRQLELQREALDNLKTLIANPGAVAKLPDDVLTQLRTAVADEMDSRARQRLGN
jgi:hypothetical protein